MQSKEAAVHPAEGINGSNPHHTGPTARPKPTAAKAELLPDREKGKTVRNES